MIPADVAFLLLSKRMNIFNSMIQSPTSTQLYLCMPTLLSSLSLNVGVDHLCTPPLKKGPKPLLISNIQSNIFIQQLFEDKQKNIVFFFLSIIFDLFYAEKTLLSKLANLWYLLSKKVNFDAQHWLQCTKKGKNNRWICEKINVRRVINWDFLGHIQTLCLHLRNLRSSRSPIPTLHTYDFMNIRTELP